MSETKSTESEAPAAVAGAAQSSAGRIKTYVAIGRKCLDRIIIGNNVDTIRRREIEMCFKQIEESADKILATNPPNAPLHSQTPRQKTVNSPAAFELPKTSGEIGGAVAVGLQAVVRSYSPGTSIPLENLPLNDECLNALARLGYTETGSFTEQDDEVLFRELSPQNFNELKSIIEQLKDAYRNAPTTKKRKTEI